MSLGYHEEEYLCSSIVRQWVRHPCEAQGDRTMKAGKEIESIIICSLVTILREERRKREGARVVVCFVIARCVLCTFTSPLVPFNNLISSSTRTSCAFLSPFGCIGGRDKRVCKFIYVWRMAWEQNQRSDCVLQSTVRALSLSPIIFSFDGTNRVDYFSVLCSRFFFSFCVFFPCIKMKRRITSCARMHMLIQPLALIRLSSVLPNPLFLILLFPSSSCYFLFSASCIRSMQTVFRQQNSS